MKFWSKLKERRIFQIMIAYLGGGWALIEVVDQMADRGVVSDMVYQIVLLWFVVGIFAVLLIGWHHGEKGKQRAPISEILLLVILATTGVGFSTQTVRREQMRVSVEEASRDALLMRNVAVQYFDDLTPGRPYAYLADALTEELITELKTVSGLTVVSRNGVAQFRGEDLTPDSVARALNVGTVVRGYVETRGDNVTVDLRAYAANGTPVGTARIERRLDDVEELQDRVSAETATLISSWIQMEVDLRRRAASTRNNAAWVLLQQGEKAWKDGEALLRRGDLAGAVRLFDEADASFARAQAADAQWPDPSASRAALSYRRSRISQGDPAEAVRFASLAVQHAEAALQNDPNHARALEMRGTAKYFQWLLRVESNVVEQQRLHDQARADLEAAVRFDPGLASAYSTLSHLYYRESIPDAIVAAKRAYEQDQYLDAADVVLWRLFNGSVELRLFNDAQRWCEEGGRRFPADYRFVSCRLRIMSTPGAEPDIQKAWALLEEQDALVPGRIAELEHVRGLFTVGGVIARAARTAEKSPVMADRENAQMLSDSARAVVDRASARVTPELDRTNELLLVEAYMRSLTGETSRAADLLIRYSAVDPSLYARKGELPWWYENLRDEPRVRRLFGLD